MGNRVAGSKWGFYRRLQALIALIAFVPNGLLWAGEPTPSPAKKKTDSVKLELKEPNPLSFWEGRLIFDIEERVRVEWRKNNRDFDGTADDDNDDSWLLNRFRLGLAVKPVSWLKFYGQAQD